MNFHFIILWIFLCNIIIVFSNVLWVNILSENIFILAIIFLNKG